MKIPAGRIMSWGGARLYAELAAIILPVLIVAFIGFAWAKFGKGFDTRLVTQLATNIGTPALAADTLMRVHVANATLIEMAGLTLACFAGFILLGLIALRLMRLPVHSYLPALVFPNSGNMGLPLCLFAFGEAGLALAVVFFTVSATLHFTLGVSIAAGEISVKRLLRMR
jgi:malate permease and related proteins